MKISRKKAITYIAGIAATPAIGFPDCLSVSKQNLKENINHSVCRWPYSNKSLEELCEVAADIGIKSVELLNPEEWKIARKYGLTCAMANGSPLHIPKGFIDPKYHKQLKKDFFDLIPKAVEDGLPNIICFSGNKNGLDEETGLENAAKGLDPIVKLAEKQGIIVCMELLNSKVDHADYMCDHTSWGVQLVEKIGSPNFKLLYDIYHMQIMEGDVIRTIRTYKDHIGHYHTGGVPGRNEIDETQELNYMAIMKAIADTGFNGYVAQEFIPKNEDSFASLKKAIEICTI